MHRRTAALSRAGVLAAPLIALMPLAALADTPPHGYTFTAIAFLGDPAPGGGNFTNDFEATALNSKGDLAFTADLAVINGISNEGVWLASGGKIIPIMRHGQPAPGGGTFSTNEGGTLGLNDAGDLALAFTLEPLGSPFGLNMGIYRWSHTTQTLTPVVVPGVTPAPGGGTFAGGIQVALTNQGEIPFGGFTATGKGVHVAGEPYVGYGVGVYVADAQGKIRAVAAPGDPAPGGSTFDTAGLGGNAGRWMNDAGDITFGGHRASDPVGQQPAPQSVAIGADWNVYVKRAASGQIEAVASSGDPLPGGGALVAGAPLGLNNAGDILFANLLNPAVIGGPVALYLRSGGQTVRVAGPGDAMPGGGKIALIGTGALNNQGDVAFNAALDTKEEGLYLYSHGAVSLIARTGTDMPGVGTLYDVEEGSPSAPGVPAVPVGAPAFYVLINDAGQVAFPATLKDARIGLLMATPKS